MASTEKANSAADSKEKSAILGDDFGKDFLNFWGPSKKGNDKMDFDVEEVPRNKKKSFNFDKLDDFELGGDFGKLPSFKIDMPDLDFSTPVTKDDKPTEKHTGKQESKPNKYSFKFDFNELDRFDLASSPVKAERKSSNIANINASDCSLKPVQNLSFRSNSDRSTDAFKGTLNTDSMATSRPDNSIVTGDTKDSKDLRHSISHYLDQHDASHELHTSIGKQNSGVEENKDKTHSNEYHKAHQEESCFTRTNAENTTQDFILQSVSGNCSGQKNNRQCLVGPASLDAAKADSAREGDDSMRTVDSSQSRNSSPVNSYKEHCPETRAIEVLNTSVDLQKHCKQNQNEVTRGNEVPRESGQGQVQISMQSASFTGCSLNMTKRVNRITGDKPNSDPKSIPCPLQRDARAVNPKSLNEKVAASLQMNSLNKSKNNGSLETSLATKKRLDFADTNKLKTLNMHPMKENRKSKQNDEQAEFGNAGLSKPNAEGSVKAISHISRSEREDDQSDTSSFQLNISNLPKQTTNTSLLVQNEVPGTSSIRCSKAVSVERSKLAISSYVPKSAMTKEAKLVRFSQSSLKFPLNMTTKMESTVLTEKSGPMNSCLKRKHPEETIADSDSVKPLKRVMESVNARCREQYEVSQKSEKIVDHETENMGIAHRHGYTEALASNDILNLESSNDTEVRLLIEKDGKAEKTKELDDTYPNKQITIAEENKKEIRGSDGHRDQSKGTCLTKANFQLKAFSLQQQFIASDAAKCITPNTVSIPAPQKSSKIVSFESDATAAKYANAFDKLTISRKEQNPATTREVKSARISEHNSEFPSKTASKMSSSISEKAACFTALLKRKTFENSNDDPKNSDQLKHVMESAIGRMKVLVSPNPERFVSTEEMEASHIENCAEAMNSDECPELGAPTGIEVLAPMEKDDNVQKAEACMKQLDDMCDKLRKKQEEARELLVRAIVNNSSMVMLNCPLFEEKIHSLQRFAASLQSKKFY